MFGIAINGEAHAYPLRILDWHEMANITVGGVPISLAYCTLCGAAIAYDDRGPDGETYNFGTSGFLYRSNKLMYDRNTRTLWNQFTGEPVLGSLVGALDLEGEPLRLNLLPVVLSTYEDWLERHPNSVVLDIDTGYLRPYEQGAAYGHYFSDPSTMFPVWLTDNELHMKEYVYGLRLGGARKAYPIDVLAEERVVNDMLNDWPVVLVTAQEIDTLGYGRGVGPVLYPSGGEVRAFDRGDRSFAPGAEDGTVARRFGGRVGGDRGRPRRPGRGAARAHQRAPRVLVRVVRVLPGDRDLRRRVALDASSGTQWRHRRRCCARSPRSHTLRRGRAAARQPGHTTGGGSTAWKSYEPPRVSRSRAAQQRSSRAGTSGPAALRVATPAAATRCRSPSCSSRRARARSCTATPRTSCSTSLRASARSARAARST